MRTLLVTVLVLLGGCGSARIDETTFSLRTLTYSHRELSYSDLFKSPTATGFRWHGQNIDLGSISSKSEITGADIASVVANIAAVVLKVWGVP